MKTRSLLASVCAGEALTGLALLAHPPTVVPLLLGSEITGAGIAITRIGGIALIALGAACWPGSAKRGEQVMAAYSIAVAAYMALVVLTGSQVGMLWWPALVTHAVLGVLLTRAISREP